MTWAGRQALALSKQAVDDAVVDDDRAKRSDVGVDLGWLTSGRCCWLSGSKGSKSDKDKRGRGQLSVRSDDVDDDKVGDVDDVRVDVVVVDVGLTSKSGWLMKLMW